MIRAFALALGLLFVGELATTLMNAPIPGAALGLTAVVALFALRGRPDPDLERLFDGVAPHTPLLFVPTAAGLVAHVDLLALFWVPIVVAVVLGTATTLVVAGLCAQALLCSERSAA
ncbi:LrgA family protein [Tranquillimonas rosea]|uniref:LrgA family protein n=1 Tax=Tranquillimonas rosea TaxID=641238 RepID=A0A1H9SSG3_9RHOB|nr:CidA/LrgA family protein [Tranquillimonas rosea]SER87896.1 LrgA family protein [Tranquillimonas rosea]